MGYHSGPFTREIEINNSKARYTLTKGSTHDMVLKWDDENSYFQIAEKTGAIVSVKGRYYKEGEQPGPNDERPLYLLVQADTEEQLAKAVEMIEKIMRQPNVCVFLYFKN